MLARTMTDIAQEIGGRLQSEERHENHDFPLWLVLLCEPGREHKSQGWLRRWDIFTYLPQFKKSYCRRGGRRYRRDCAVIPGLLFMPQVMTWVDRASDRLDWARVRGCMRGATGSPVVLELDDIVTIMRIEAKLNRPDHPVDARGTEIMLNCRVRFIDPANERLFGEAIVFEVASDHRIGVEASGLFGGKVKVYVPAVEIEVM